MFELSIAGEELAAAGGLADKLRKDLKAPKLHPVLVPRQIVGAEPIPIGYAFAQSGLPERNYRRAGRAPYVESLLLIGDAVALVSGAEVDRMLCGLERANALRRGKAVEVLAGSYLGVCGRVLGMKGPHRVIVEARTATKTRRIVVDRIDLAESADRSIPQLSTARSERHATRLGEQLKLPGEQ